MSFDTAFAAVMPRLRDYCGQAVTHKRRDAADETITAGVQARDGEDYDEAGSRYTRSRLTITVVRGDLANTLDTWSRFLVNGRLYDVTTLMPDADCIVVGCERVDRLQVGTLNR